MSKAFHALAKLARSEAEEVQRQLAGLLNEDELLLRRIHARAAMLQREARLAVAPADIAAFNRFNAAEMERDRADQAAREALAGRIDLLREDLSTHFREAKKLENLLEERAAGAKRAIARAEQALADERASHRAGR